MHNMENPPDDDELNVNLEEEDTPDRSKMPAERRTPSPSATARYQMPARSPVLIKLLE